MRELAFLLYRGSISQLRADMEPLFLEIGMMYKDNDDELFWCSCCKVWVDELVMLSGRRSICVNCVSERLEDDQRRNKGKNLRAKDNS